METPYLCSSEEHKHDGCVSQKTSGTAMIVTTLRSRTLSGSEDLSRDIFLGVLLHGGSKNLGGLSNFDFRILKL